MPRTDAYVSPFQTLIKKSASRRAVVAGAAAAAGVLAVPASGFALPAVPATRIQSLWQEHQAFLPEYERLDRDVTEARDRYYAMTATMPVPDELKINELWARMFGVAQWLRIGDRQYAGQCIDTSTTWLSTKGWQEAVNNPIPPGNEWWSVRSREALPIAEKYAADIAAAGEATGHTEACKACEAAIERMYAIEDAIFAETAETIADLYIVVLAIEARDYIDADYYEIPPDVARMLVRSIKAIAGA